MNMAYKETFFYAIVVLDTADCPACVYFKQNATLINYLIFPNYTVSQKVPTFKLSVTLSGLDRFLNFCTAGVSE